MTVIYVPRAFGGTIILNPPTRRKFTTMTICRGNGPIATQTIIARGIVAQIDQKSLDMMQFDKGAAPYDLFSLEAWTDVMRRNDHLVDENSPSDVYTVSTRVETFLDGHSECDAFISVGS